MLFIKNFINEEKGSVLIFMGFLLPVLVALGGLVIDGGVVFFKQSQLSGAVDAAAWAALDSYDRDVWNNFQEVSLNQGEADRLASQYLKMNMPEAKINIVEIISSEEVQVVGKVNCPVYFLSVFGVEEIQLNASAKAKLK